MKRGKDFQRNSTEPIQAQLEHISIIAWYFTLNNR